MPTQNLALMIDLTTKVGSNFKRVDRNNLPCLSAFQNPARITILKPLAH